MSSFDDPMPPSVWRWPPPLSLLWLLLPVVGVTISVGFAAVSPHDYWWHLAFGRLIAETGAIPSANLFLYTMPADAAFLDQPWLAQWFLYRLVDRFGHVGPYLCRAVITAGVWAGLVWAAARRCRDRRVVGAVALVAVVASAGVFSVRSRLFALPLYTATIVIVTGVADRRLDTRYLGALVPIVALWANLHGSFVLAPALVGLTGLALALEYGLGREETALETWSESYPWAAVFGLLLVAGCLTPHGAAIYGYVADIALSPRVAGTVTEWQPLNPTERFGGFVLAGIVCGVVALAWRLKRVPLHELALYVGTATLAVSSSRSVFWWAAVAALILPRHLVAILPGTGGDDEPSALEGSLHATIAVALIGAVVAIQPGMPGFVGRTVLVADNVRSSAPGAGLLSSRTPIGLVERVADREEPGRIFHDQAIGGLIEYHLGADDPANPTQVAFVDQRMGLIPQEIWRDYFVVAKAKEGWQETLDDWEVETLIVHTEEQKALVAAAERSATWRREAEEGNHYLYVRLHRP